MSRRLLCTLTILLTLFIVLSTLVPIGLRPRLFGTADVERELAFAALGVLLGLSVGRLSWRWLLAGMLFAFALEWAQHLIPSRHGQWHDAAIKASAFAVGYIIIGGLRAAHQRWQAS